MAHKAKGGQEVGRRGLAPHRAQMWAGVQVIARVTFLRDVTFNEGLGPPRRSHIRRESLLVI